MASEEPIISSLAVSSSAQFCSKATCKSTHVTDDINKMHDVEEGITPTQSSAENEDLMKPSSEIQQGIGEDGVEQGVVAFKDLDSLMKLTVAELRGMMRKLGMPPTGRKQDLILALKNFSGKSNAGQDSESHTIESAVGYREEANMLSEPAPDKRSTRKKRKVVKSIENSNVLDANATTDVEVDFNYEQPWTMLVHKKAQLGWVAYNPTTMRPISLLDRTNMIRLISWNVNGLRALLKRKEENSIVRLAEREKFDVLCLQETKLQEKDVEQIKQGLLDGYKNSFWTCSVSKLGYSGTAVISRIKPISMKFGLGIPDHDSEGRLITLEFDTFYLVAGYVPNSGQKLERLTYRVQQWDPSLSSYIKELEKQKPVVLTGDLNCAHEEIDIYNPDGNRRSAGFTDEERSSFEANFLKKGFVDSFRRQHPNTVGYTYWGYRQGARADNRGWRLDYFLVSDSIIDDVYDSYILPDINGSDHCPIGLILKL
eukprot:Gb_02033 [translate_table: standard]